MVNALYCYGLSQYSARIYKILNFALLACSGITALTNRDVINSRIHG